MSSYGTGIEFNPLMRSLFEASPVNAALFKLALLIFYLILIPFAARRNYTLAYCCLSLNLTLQFSPPITEEL
ncbi:DUF5658 family protein [Syntrophaceticus schinkii]|uniref:DUF5658 family protein n=1 Tax=Syntrophaceticus schinkii TaxID=499207 RepID=UPI0038CD43EC